MHIETGGLSRRPKQHHQKVRSLVGEKERSLCDVRGLEGGWGWLVKPGSIVSDPPKQKMVGTVIPSDCFTAIGQSEVLIAIAAGNH